MIEGAAQLSFEPPGARPSGAQREPEFSYAEAATALERAAGKALQVHGPKPLERAPVQNHANGAEQVAPRPVPTAQASEQRASQGAQPMEAREAPGAPAAKPEASAPPAARGAAQSARIAPLIPAIGPAVPAAASVPPALAREASSASAAARSEAPKIQKPAAPPPAAPQADFARLLARRLEQSSVFEFRLDPPELGRIEGRLVIGDDNKASLNLRFDSQAAFDLFARDEQGLRAALMGAGYEFSGGAFSFEFAGREAAKTAGAHRFDVAASDERHFIAPWSAGALDIRI